MNCPVYQCGGRLKIIDDEGEDGWQTPLLVCDNCHAVYKFQGFKVEQKIKGITKSILILPSGKKKKEELLYSDSFEISVDESELQTRFFNPNTTGR
jgi:hypothetical protein